MRMFDADGSARPCLGINIISTGERGWCSSILRGFFREIEARDQLGVRRRINRGIVCDEPNEYERRLE